MKMNKLRILFSFIFLVVLTTSVLAQPQIKDSIEAYNYWAKRGIIEAIYAYMQDLEEVRNLYPKEEAGKNDYNEQYVKNISNANVTEINNQYNSLSEFLLKSNYDWRGCEKTIFQPMKKQLDNSNQSHNDLNFLFNLTRKDKNGSDIPIDFIGDKNGNDLNKRLHWIKTKERIISNYSDALEKLTEKHKTQEPVVSQPIVEEKQNVSEPVNRHNKRSNVDWLKWTKIFGIFMLGLLLGGSLVFFISKRKIYSILDFEKDKYLHDLRLSGKNFIFKYIGLFYVLKQRKEDYKNKIDSKNGNKPDVLLKEQIEALKRENLKLKQINDTSTKQTKSVEDKKSSTNEWDVEKPRKTKQKLFFSMPENDGRFIIDNGEPSNDGRKYFRIDFFEDSENGELFFIPSERDKRAINRLESYLKPVCEIENIANAENATHIEFISPGKVIYRNNSWIIESDKRVNIKLL